MRYVRKKEKCSGCRACEQVCPVGCITIVPDEEGFLYPVIDENSCIDCQKCLELCSNNIKVSPSLEKKAYALKNINEDIRKQSSSGGVFYELAMEALRREGKVYGAAFDEYYQVQMIEGNTEESIRAFMGSKYVQGDTGTSYQEVQKLLDKGIFVLYSGTPCQIKGLKQYLNEESENLLCVSLICHGVPSRMVWNRYVKLKMGQYAEEEPTRISFRDKQDGWRNMNLKIDFKNHSYSDIHSHDLYFQGFNQNLFLRPSCYQCEAKNVDTDIIIGDFWGIEQLFPELDDGQGVSCLIVNSSKGLSYWNAIKSRFINYECSVEDIVQNNPFLYESVPKNPNRKSFFAELKATGLLEESLKDNLKVLTISQELRKQYHYEILKQYLKKQIRAESIFEPIIQHGYRKICLYAITDLTELVIYDLLQLKKCEVIYVCDRNYKKYQNGIWGIKVIDQKYLISDILNKNIDLVLVCNPMRENDIFDELIEGGIPQEKIISIISLIFG